jgi:SAM-dependent methyltransferase
MTSTNEPEWERSRSRWREPPTDWAALTWGHELTGDAFIEKAQQHAEFSADKTVLEIGPGYGRILTTCLERGIPFSRYIGLDLSEETIGHLRRRFTHEKVEFFSGDVETASFDTEFHVVLSSLTLKHLYPSFEVALQNLAGQAAPGSTFCIDFSEIGAPKTEWEFDGTYIRYYTKAELREIFDRVGLEHVAFEEVRHLPDQFWWRVMVVARKPE